MTAPVRARQVLQRHIVEGVVLVVPIERKLFVTHFTDPMLLVHTKITLPDSGYFIMCYWRDIRS